MKQTTIARHIQKSRSSASASADSHKTHTVRTGVAKASAVRLHNVKKTRKTKETPAYETATDRDYLEQADICCEQARVAARLKRFTAALGLFRTAQSLYTRSISLGGDACHEAQERLHNLTQEMSTYCEMARIRTLPGKGQSAGLNRPETRLPAL